jgi:hypothetical protein
VNYALELEEVLGEYPELARVRAAGQSLDELLGALDDIGFNLRRFDSVSQDEFSYDLLCPFPTGEHVLVFGVT